MIPVAGIAVAIFVADQLTKLWALAGLSPARPIVVLPGLVDLTLVFNTGVAFGFFSRLPPEWRWLVSVFSLAALVLLCSVALRIVPEGGWLGRLALGLVFGGAAVGALADATPGSLVAAAVLSMEPVAYQVKGDFAGLRAGLGRRFGVIDVRESYSACPPLPGERLPGGRPPSAVKS